ncbi:MAG: hypothetical protein AAF235_01930 [Planctomycetota bacterium]
MKPAASRLVLCALSLVFAAVVARADPLTAVMLEPHTARFTLEKGTLAGPGAEVLAEAFASHHAVLLGEYHGSELISRFTEAIIPTLDAEGYRHMVLEVGPAAGRILTGLAGDGSQTVRALARFHTRYALPGGGGDGDWSPPIPFFDSVADAEFLAAAASRGWVLFGIDQEFIDGYLPVLDAAIGSLPADAIAGLGDLPDRARRAILEAHAAELADEGDAAEILLASDDLNACLDAITAADMRGAGGRAAETAADIRASLEIYRLNAVGDWWNSNRTRIAGMKGNFDRGAARAGLDVGEDKFVVKMGAVHTGRGLSLLRHYEIGNTISELCELRGGRSVHLSFAARFSRDETAAGGVTDGLETDKRYGVIRSMGAADVWTLVDLRPLKRAVFYDWIETERFAREWFLQHDLIVIPPADGPSPVNRAVDGR